MAGGPTPVHRRLTESTESQVGSILC